MLQRCIARPSLCPRLRQCHRVTRQFARPAVLRDAASPSAGPTTSSPKPRKWYLYAVIGLAGFTIGSWYRILGFSKKTDSFVPFELVAKEQVSSTASIFTVKSHGNRVSTSAWKAGIWNVEFKQPQLQIVRAYTPLPPNPEDVDPKTNSVDSLRFLIRQDSRGGEMSSYVHRLPVGATLELRGPNVEYRVTPDVKNVIFVAGGTGIAPAMQVAHAMFDGLDEKEKEGKKLHILWANRRREDCAGGTNDDVSPTKSDAPLDNSTTESSWSSWILGPKKQDKSANHTLANVHPATSVNEQPNLMVQQLQDLKSRFGGNITVSYFVDEEKTYVHSGNIERALAALPKDAGSNPTQIIVSGPPGFITYIAGPKVWKDGEEQQGPLGGRLAQVLGADDRTDVKVWKV